MRNGRRHISRAALLALLAAGGACTDASNPVAPKDPAPTGPGGPQTALQALQCTANRTTLSVTCAPASEGAGAASGILLGSQGVNVRLTSSNVAYNNVTGQFTFDVTVQNLIEQPLGTTDGTTSDAGGVRVFFAVPPTVTVGSGVAAPLPDGFGTFTGAGQPYYQYSGNMLEQNETSAAKGWTLIISPTVETFSFLLFVSAAVEYPTGYITLNGNLPGASAGSLHPGTDVPLVAVSKTQFGTVVPGATHTFGTTDALCASVSPGGVVTGVRYATCSITVTDGVRSGDLGFDVTGTTRVWQGDVSADWAVGGNWAGDLTPAVVDTASVPTGVPSFPALTAPVTIGGVLVADGATLSLGAFDLTASADVITGPTAGSGVLATTGVLRLVGAGEAVQGRVPSLVVTGSYTLSGDLFLVAPETVDAGRLDVDLFEMRIDAQ
jgi:hypothetical protein